MTSLSFSPHPPRKSRAVLLETNYHKLCIHGERKTGGEGGLFLQTGPIARPTDMQSGILNCHPCACKKDVKRPVTKKNTFVTHKTEHFVFPWYNTSINLS